jgi:predicted DCC family thiol-disulfide oxidoreductase YuxK
VNVRPAILYDGDCRFCRFVARGIVRLDRSHALSVLPFEDPEAQHLLATVPTAERETTWHLVRDGRRTSGGPALADLVGVLPATRPLAPVLRLLPLAAIYGFVSRRRGRLGRLVPDGPAPRQR